jgi:hypothetical protein
MVTKSVSLSNPIYEILQQTAGVSNINDALAKILKDFFQLKIHALQEKVSNYEKKYNMSFADFEEACKNGKIKSPYSYEIEKDGWEWDAAITEMEDLMEYEQWLL